MKTTESFGLTVCAPLFSDHYLFEGQVVPNEVVKAVRIRPDCLNGHEGDEERFAHHVHIMDADGNVLVLSYAQFKAIQALNLEPDDDRWYEESAEAGIVATDYGDNAVEAWKADEAFSEEIDNRFIAHHDQVVEQAQFDQSGLRIGFDVEADVNPTIS